MLHDRSTVHSSSTSQTSNLFLISLKRLKAVCVLSNTVLTEKRLQGFNGEECCLVFSDSSNTWQIENLVKTNP